jgi:hypothetical protein
MASTDGLVIGMLQYVYCLGFDRNHLQTACVWTAALACHGNQYCKGTVLCCNTNVGFGLVLPATSTGHQTPATTTSQGVDLRHVTMGYTVAFQRFLMFVVGPSLHATFRIVQVPAMDWNRMLTSIEIQRWYNVTSIVAVIIPLVLMEKLVIQRPFLLKLGTANSYLDRKRD